MSAMMFRASVWAIVLLVVASTFLGCAGHANSDDLAGESVTLRLIPAGEWPIEAGPDPTTARLQALEGTPGMSAVGPLLLAEGIRLGVQLIQQEMNKEINRYERQFSRTVYDGGYWENDAARYVGFEIIRTTKSHPDARNPAFRFVCAFVDAFDKRIIVLEPRYLKVNSAKAKVATTEGSASMSVRVNINLDGAWVQRGRFVAMTLANTDWEVTGYDLDQRPAIVRYVQSADGAWQPTGGFAHDQAGWFFAPQAGSGRISGGAFKLSVVVTERDESKARQYLEKVSKLIDEQSKKLMEELP